MAKNKFGLDFEGFLDYARQVDELGKDKLREAVDNALQKSKEYANEQIGVALDNSLYNFSGNGTSQGDAKRSLQEVNEKPVEWDGDVASCYIGPSLKEAPQAIILAIGHSQGSPHIKGDTNLKNALKVKGNYKREVERIQKEEFLKVIKEGMNG